jgi:hypothetical protein
MNKPMETDSRRENKQNLKTTVSLFEKRGPLSIWRLPDIPNIGNAFFDLNFAFISTSNTEKHPSFLHFSQRIFA